MKLLDFDLNNLPEDQSLIAADQHAELLTQLDHWEVIEIDSENRLFCVFKCDDFVAAMNFAQEITVIAEQVDHHPALLIEWGKLSVSWWTHSLGGLHINDFIMAAYTQQLYSRQ